MKDPHPIPESPAPSQQATRPEPHGASPAPFDPPAPGPRPLAPAGVPALVPFLILVFATFIGILVYTWVESKKANPQMIQLGYLSSTDRS